MALAMQTKCYAVNKYPNRKDAYARMRKTLDELHKQIFAAKKFLGDSLKLVVLPEYFMTGFPMRESLKEWRSKCVIKGDDDLFSVIGEIAKSTDVFISGNYYESDDHFSHLYFQSSFIVDDSGNKVLNYRRLNSVYTPTPHDVLDKYVEVYGYESLFPVADTSIGRLACIASEEILYPEVARCLMMRGAEVICHSSSEIGSPRPTKKVISKQARAIENICYVVSANSAGIADVPILENSTDGGSQIVHYEGHVLAETYPGESIVANGYLSIASLRNYRAIPGMRNYRSRQRFELYGPSYSETSYYPPNTCIEEKEVNKKMFAEALMLSTERLNS